MPKASDSMNDRVTRALRRAYADAIERARIFGTPLIRENPNLIRELMGNDDPPIGHWGPLPRNQMAPPPVKRD